MPLQLSHGMGENFKGPCDLIITQPRAQLHTSVKGTPMIIIGQELRSQTYSRFALAPLTLLGRWGVGRAVWIANAAPFEVDLSELAEEFETFPVELPRRLLAAYPGKKDVVADPFMGRGTAGKAVLEYGGEFIGIDSNKDRVRKAYTYLGCESL